MLKGQQIKQCGEEVGREGKRSRGGFGRKVWRDSPTGLVNIVAAKITIDL